MKTKCVLSTGSKENLQKMINEYFYSENYIITDDMRIYNTKNEKYLNNYIVQVRKSRWSFRIKEV